MVAVAKRTHQFLAFLKISVQEKIQFRSTANPAAKRQAEIHTFAVKRFFE